MATAEDTAQARKVTVDELRGEAAFGSSYAAYLLACEIRPTDLPELLSLVRVYQLTGRAREEAFNACVDGYTVFHDARTHHKLQ